MIPVFSYNLDVVLPRQIEKHPLEFLPVICLHGFWGRNAVVNESKAVVIGSPCLVFNGYNRELREVVLDMKNPLKLAERFVSHIN